MVRATDLLEAEHRLIERLLLIFEIGLQHLEKGEPVPAPFFEKIVDFVRHFADRCHHGKEEDVLFPLMKARGIPMTGGPIGVMLMEHDEGRRLVKAMEEATRRYAQGEPKATRDLLDSGSSYIQLLRQHIHKEDQILYPMANRFFSPDDQNELIEKFETIEHERTGEGEHQRYHTLLESLEKEWSGSAPP